jgi:hypothetical protein
VVNVPTPAPAVPGGVVNVPTPAPAVPGEVHSAPVAAPVFSLPVPFRPYPMAVTIVGSFTVNGNVVTVPSIPFFDMSDGRPNYWVETAWGIFSVSFFAPYYLLNFEPVIGDQAIFFSGALPNDHPALIPLGQWINYFGSASGLPYVIPVLTPPPAVTP